MHPSTKISLIALSILLIFIAPVFAGVSDLSITERTTAFNFLDVGNATALNNSTLWVNIQHGGGFNNSNFTNVTFVLPFGVNPSSRSYCNATQQNLVANYPSTNDTFNLTSNTCTIGYWNLSLGGSINVSLNVTINMSALAMNHIARGANTVPARIFAIVNATNNTSTVNYGVVSGASLHNSTSFWINPRPYAYTAGDAASNGTVRIMDFNQTRNGYQLMAPLLTYNSTVGYPQPASGTFAEIVYFDRPMMEAASDSDSGAPMYMELFSYNLTFRIVAPFAQNGSAVQTYYINSPVAGASSNQSLMPLLIRQEYISGPMGKNLTLIMGVPSQSGFTVRLGSNSTASDIRGIYTDTNLSSLRGINLTYVPTYDASTPMLTLTSSNVSAFNNTDISILFTLANMATPGSSSSPIYVKTQQISGFSGDSPPPLGANITTSFLINLSNMLDNYTLSNLTIRFMMPKSAVVLNGSGAGGGTQNISNFDNASLTYTNQTTGYSSYQNGWGVTSNYSLFMNVTDKAPGSAQGTNISINLTFADVQLTNGSFNRWLPGAQAGSRGYAALNFTIFMSFPTLNQSNVTPGTAGSRNSFNATVQMPMQGRLNLTDKVPGLSSSASDYNITVDGASYTPADGNVTIGSLFLNNVGSGSHSISVSYVVASSTASSSTGGAAGGSSGGGAAAGTAATITPDAPVATIDKAVAGTTVSISIQVAVPSDSSGGGGGTTKEAHKMEIVSITGTLIKLKFTSDPVYVDINVGQTKYIDINGDGVNDVKVTANSVSGGVASITVELMPSAKGQAATKPYVPSTPSVEQPTAPSEPAPTALSTAVPAKPVSPIMIIVVLAALLVAGVAYYLYSQKSK